MGKKDLHIVKTEDSTNVRIVRVASGAQGVRGVVGKPPGFVVNRHAPEVKTNDFTAGGRTTTSGTIWRD